MNRVAPDHPTDGVEDTSCSYPSGLGDDLEAKLRYSMAASEYWGREVIRLGERKAGSKRVREKGEAEEAVEHGVHPAVVINYVQNHEVNRHTNKTKTADSRPVRDTTVATRTLRQFIAPVLERGNTMSRVSFDPLYAR